MIYAMPFYTNIKCKEGTEQYLNRMSQDWVKEANSRLKELRVICGNVGFKFLSNMYGRVIMETQSWMDGYTCRRCGRCFSDMLNTSVLNALGEGGYMDASQVSVAFKTGRTPAFIEYKAFVTPNRHITENELRERGWLGEEVWFRSCCNGKMHWFNTGIVISVADDGLHADIDRSNWDSQSRSRKIARNVPITRIYASLEDLYLANSMIRIDQELHADLDRTG